jgi:hypothetical protein
MHLKYFAPRAELVRLQLEGAIADVSCWPTIKSGNPEYLEFENYTDLNGQDVLLF